MVYKSKKINRKRYLKDLQKQTGGTGTGPGNLERIKNIILNLINKVAATGIQTIEGEIELLVGILGINKNADVKVEVKRILEQILKLKEALESEEGKQALSELGAVVAKVSKEILAPGLTQIADRFIHHSDKMASTSINAAMNAISVSPVGILFSVFRLLTNIVKLAENSTELAGELLKITKDMVDKSKLQNNGVFDAIIKLKTVIDNGNASLSQVLTKAENITGSQTSTGTQHPAAQAGGRLLNNYRHQAQMIGGRIRKSQLEFFSANVNSSANVKQNNTKRKTKRKMATHRL